MTAGLRAIPRALRDAYRAAINQGWRIEVTGNQHLKWKPPTGDMVVTASTPSDHRGIKNALKELERKGLRLGKGNR